MEVTSTVVMTLPRWYSTVRGAERARAASEPGLRPASARPGAPGRAVSELPAKLVLASVASAAEAIAQVYAVAAVPRLTSVSLA